MGDTPLHRAAVKGCMEAMKLFEQYGADVNTKNHVRVVPPLAFCLRWHSASQSILLCLRLVQRRSEATRLSTWQLGKVFRRS